MSRLLFVLLASACMLSACQKKGAEEIQNSSLQEPAQAAAVSETAETAQPNAVTGTVQ